MYMYSLNFLRILWAVRMSNGQNSYKDSYIG